jgi:hypothetical protein
VGARQGGRSLPLHVARGAPLWHQRAALSRFSRLAACLCFR